VLRRLRAVRQGKGRLLAPLLPYEDGTPSHDTFGRLLRLIKPEQFEAVLADLARRVTAGSAGHVAIDGKTVRGSADVARGVRALHLLHAFATDVGLCIGQVAVDGKSNEITALPELLKLLDLSVIEDHPKRGRDVTMDAMHTQRASAKLLHEAGAHDVMALKGNQPTLLDDVRTVLGDPLVPVLEHEETNVGHGRVETRAARVSTDVAGLAHHCWPGLAAVRRVGRTRTCKRTGATTAESQLYLLGHGYTPERLLALSRGHWAEVVKVPSAKPVEYGRRALRTTCTGFWT
jgi:predicted transposase YbfD/YdcC